MMLLLESCGIESLVVALGHGVVAAGATFDAGDGVSRVGRTAATTSAGMSRHRNLAAKLWVIPGFSAPEREPRSQVVRYPAARSPIGHN